jgi:biopolymer transport protein TolR
VSKQAGMLYNRANSVKRICRIDVTAFASIMAFLVVLMMLPLGNAHHGVGVDLPKVWHPIEMRSANREDALTIAVFRDGQVFLCNDRATVSELSDKIRERLSHGAERKVYIRADARARYGTVRAVLDAVHSSGVGKNRHSGRSAQTSRPGAAR